MKITAVRATPVNIPFVAPYRFSYGAIAALTKTVIELETEDGVTGLGECADGDRSADVLAMGAQLIGQDVRDIHPAALRCIPQMRYTPWGSVQAARRAFGGIEMAMWDARGKTEGQPLYRLLGGAVRREIPLTEYFSYRLPGADHPGENSPLEVARTCAAMIERHGSRIFEGKVGTVALDEEVEMVREVRAAIGDRPLQLDANGVWTLPTARRALARFAPYDVSWFEEPCEGYEALAALRQHSDMGFSSHIVDLRLAARIGTPDAIVTNINEHGGIDGTAAFVAACAAQDIGFRFHSGETGIASAAYLHMTAALEHIRGASQTLFRWYADDVIEGGPFQPQDGHVRVPEGPGLGVTLDRKALARCHRRYCDQGAFPSGGEVSGTGYGRAFRRI